MTDVRIRAEATNDYGAIRRINQAAFNGSEEADLVESLRKNRLVLLSLVADLDGRAVAHILFSRMAIDTAAGAVDAVALAPMAVLPEYQRQGIGGRLIRRGLDDLRRCGEAIVI